MFWLFDDCEGDEEGQRPRMDPGSSWLRCFRPSDEGLGRSGDEEPWFGEGVPLLCEGEVGERNLELTSRNLGLLGLRD